MFFSSLEFVQLRDFINLADFKEESKVKDVMKPVV